MNRTEIVQQIEKILWNHLNDDVAQVCELTDLFIELSSERCKEQVELCYNSYENADSRHGVGSDILDTELPEID